MNHDDYLSHVAVEVTETLGDHHCTKLTGVSDWLGSATGNHLSEFDDSGT
jgi:hypothetical protein